MLFTPDIFKFINNKTFNISVYSQEEFPLFYFQNIYYSTADCYKFFVTYHQSYFSILVIYNT